MSWSERSVQDHKLRTDRAIHRACTELASDPTSFTKFQEILTCRRERAARLFEAPICEGRHLGVDTLVNLSRLRHAHIRSLNAWAGTSASWRSAVACLAHHLICNYTVPAFLASSWYATGTAADNKRAWYIAHSNGASFRSLDLPLVMTRKMEHIFLASQDHLSIEHAIRRAELLALGAPSVFVKEIMSTELATDLRHCEFWRPVWIFLIANAEEVDPVQIGPMIDYIQSARRNRVQDGIVSFGTPRQEFSMKGRTVQSMLRLMQDWHRRLGAGNASLAWVKSTLNPLLFEEPSRDGLEEPRSWQSIELLDSAQLRREGAALHHCVASYADRCYRRTSSIWSLRFTQDEQISHVLTVEVDPRRRAVIQARGRANRAASGKPLRILHDWARQEKLRMAI